MTQETINNRQLAGLMNKHTYDYHVYEYEDFLDILQEVIQEQLVLDNLVKINLLGTFNLKTSAPKKAWNMHKKEWYIRPETYTVRFKPSYTLNNNVRAAVHKLKETTLDSAVNDMAEHEQMLMDRDMGD